MVTNEYLPLFVKIYRKQNKEFKECILSSLFDGLTANFELNMSFSRDQFQPLIPLNESSSVDDKNER